MDTLPAELIELILLARLRACRSHKNNILPLRLVCKAFDTVLKPYVLRTIQLEFSKLIECRNAFVDGIGNATRALYLDMMVVRDEEEITRLTEIFNGILSRVPEMEPLLQSLRKYCLSDDTFTEQHFRTTMEYVLKSAPNISHVKINLPFQVVGKASSTATILLATTLACIAQRGSEEDGFAPLNTLVIDHVSDTTITSICSNHIDVTNTITAFSSLKNLILSIKRQEGRISRQVTFSSQLWYLIKKAQVLESLCLIGWNSKRDVRTRRHHNAMVLNDWSMRSLPYSAGINEPPLKFLRFLELKRLDIYPHHLISLIKDNSACLEELYLIETYLKVNGGDIPALWIGLDTTKEEGTVWVADELRDLNIHLRVLRVTAIGYDDFDPDSDSALTNYDLADPTGQGKSFDLRFVEAVVGDKGKVASEKMTPEMTIPHVSPASEVDLTKNTALPIVIATPLPSPVSYDADTYQELCRNTTSYYKRSIDDLFHNHNDQALRELQRIIEVADRGMSLISAEIDRGRALEIAHDGTVADL